MDKKTLAEKIENVDALRATLLLRIFSLLAIIITNPMRNTIPVWMMEWFQNISYPLLGYNILLLSFHKKVSSFLEKHAYALIFDLIIAIGILQIGGGWRSSYFVYTLTTIIIFTLFAKRKGAYISSSLLTIVAIIKDPYGGTSSPAIFDVANWDMRLGAALFYIAAGFILGYASLLIERLRELSRQKIEETRRRTAAEEKTRLAVDLHDSIKSKMTAVLLILKSLVKRLKSFDQDSENELQRLWRWMNHIQNELNQIVESLISEKPIDTSSFDIVKAAEEEARIVEEMTGFLWHVSGKPAKIIAPSHMKPTLIRFFSEALMNAWKHSGVTSGTIELKGSDGQITIVVADNGKGFHHSERKSKTSGLKSLSQRAEELNGHLVIETSPGKGCKIILSFPNKGSGI